MSDSYHTRGYFDTYFTWSTAKDKSFDMTTLRTVNCCTTDGCWASMVTYNVIGWCLRRYVDIYITQHFPALRWRELTTVQWCTICRSHWRLILAPGTVGPLAKSVTSSAYTPRLHYQVVLAASRWHRYWKEWGRMNFSAALHKEPAHSQRAPLYLTHWRLSSK